MGIYRNPWTLNGARLRLDRVASVNPLRIVGPWRKRFHAAAPRMAPMVPMVRRVDNGPRLQAFWRERFPLDRKCARAQACVPP